MAYKQLTSEHRYTLSALHWQGFSLAYIASVIGCHRSTIYREIERNKCNDGGYRPSKAISRTSGRRSRSRRNSHYTEQDFKIVRQLLWLKFSPEQITGFIKRFKLLERVPSHERIYQYIWNDKANGGNLWKHLRQALKKRRKRYRANDSRGRIAEKRHISERPNTVESRRYFGHWEIDTVHGTGSKDCIVTLVERKTGFVQIGKLNDQTTMQLNKRLTKLLNRFNNKFYKTITSDNGTEFHQYKSIENEFHLKFYFATPHHSWERGSNENMNGLIRQYLPKGTCMKALTQTKCDEIADKLNNRPRKRYGYKTPMELLNEHL